MFFGLKIYLDCKTVQFLPRFDFSNKHTGSILGQCLPHSTLWRDGSSQLDTRTEPELVYREGSSTQNLRTSFKNRRPHRFNVFICEAPPAGILRT